MAYIKWFPGVDLNHLPQAQVITETTVIMPAPKFEREYYAERNHEIRKLAATLPYRDLAFRFNLCERQIARIVTGH